MKTKSFLQLLLGIDSDEKGYPCYSPAKKRLEELVLNKEVYLERDKEDQDQYKRYLRYLIFDGENINLKWVQEGYSKSNTVFLNFENLIQTNVLQQ